MIGIPPRVNNKAIQELCWIQGPARARACLEGLCNGGYPGVSKGLLWPHDKFILLPLCHVSFPSARLCFDTMDMPLPAAIQDAQGGYHPLAAQSSSEGPAAAVPDGSGHHDSTRGEKKPTSQLAQRRSAGHLRTWCHFRDSWQRGWDTSACFSFTTQNRSQCAQPQSVSLTTPVFSGSVWNSSWKPATELAQPAVVLAYKHFLESRLWHLFHQKTYSKECCSYLADVPLKNLLCPLQNMAQSPHPLHSRDKSVVFKVMSGSLSAHRKAL